MPRSAAAEASTAPPAARPAVAPRAVVFDAYGTLFDVHSVAALAEQIFPGRGPELSLAWRRKQLEYSWLRTLSGRYKPFRAVTLDALRFATRRLGLALDAAGEQRLMNQYASLSTFPENLGALRELRAMGLPLGILTNGDPEMVAVSVRSAGMDGLFEHVLSVDAVRRFKTDPATYALASVAFGCTPREVLFVSSNAWDAIGATWAGLTTFWIDRAGEPLEALDTEPDAIGHLLTDVVAFAARRRDDGASRR